MKISKWQRKRKDSCKIFLEYKIVESTLEQGAIGFRGIFVQWLGELNNLARDTRENLQEIPQFTKLHSLTLWIVVNYYKVLYVNFNLNYIKEP